MRLVWVTDIHLNFVAVERRLQFYETMAAHDPDAVLITGDIAESGTVDRCLLDMAQVLGRPIYYVLGNHDFYRGSIVETRARVERLSRQSRHLIYLSRSGVVQLTPEIALVGHDGWGDARLGDFEHSDIILNDYLLIEELYHWNSMFELDRDALRRSLEKLGDEAARHIEALLPVALADARQVLVLTHVPPFREACWHANTISDDRWLPHFSCLAMGQVLEAAMRAHGDREMLVLCGHTHGSGAARILPNLQVLTGEAQYAHPAVSRVLEFP
jgi:predicted MPP superfamily phosphohydrolase